jgi:CRISPR-associated protein Csm3
MDNPIIRHPVSGLPYIPGSSLKGKMRSLLEIKAASYDQTTGKPCACGICDVCRLFGCGDPQKASEMTRFLFRDAMITAESESELREAKEEKGLKYPRL